MMRTERHGGPDVWEFRWREPGPDGKLKHRRMVFGTTNERNLRGAEPRSRPGANYEEDRRLHAADSRNLIVK